MCPHCPSSSSTTATPYIQTAHFPFITESFNTGHTIAIAQSQAYPYNWETEGHLLTNNPTGQEAPQRSRTRQTREEPIRARRPRVNASRNIQDGADRKGSTEQRRSRRGERGKGTFLNPKVLRIHQSQQHAYFPNTRNYTLDSKMLIVDTCP